MRGCHSTCWGPARRRLRADFFHDIHWLQWDRRFLTGYALTTMVRAALRAAKTPGSSFASVERMADGTRNNGERGAQSADEAARSARLRRLGERLDRQSVTRSIRVDPGARSSSDPSGLGRALRLSAELVGGVIVEIGRASC